MKTYKTFVEQSNSARENLNEIAISGPLVAGGLIALNTALRAGSAYDTYQSIKKKDWVGAGLNALSTVNPLGRAVAPIPRIARGAGIGAFVKDVVTPYLPKKKKEKIKEGNKLVNVRTNAGVTTGVDPSTGEYRVIKRRSDKEQEEMKNPKGFEMY